jgi:multiple antibiotic resistance protein
MISLALSAFLTLFVVIDPVGMAPVFLGLTSDRPSAERLRIARQSILVAGLVIVAFGLGGARLLSALGISLDAFRVAGGVLLFRIAVDMVYAHQERETEEEAAESRTRRDITVFPLAIPFIAGPGTLTSVMILAAQARGVAWGLLAVLGMALLVLALTYVAFRLAGPLARLLGKTGVNVISRVLGILLAALAVQYVADGVRGMLNT